MNCTICDLLITGPHIGDGEGTGQRFAHPECYRRRELDALNWAIEDCLAHYPIDIFPEPGPDDFYHLRTGPRGISERLHGSWARHLIKVIKENAQRFIEESKE